MVLASSGVVRARTRLDAPPRSPIPPSIEERTTLSDQATPEAADAAAPSTPDTDTVTATLEAAPAGIPA